MKDRERDRSSRSRGLFRCGQGSYEQDKPPEFTIVDCSTGDRYVIPAKSTDESMIRLLLVNREKEPLTVYTDGFLAYDPLNEDNAFDHGYVVHGDGQYADEDVHVNTARTTDRCCDRGSRHIETSRRINLHSISDPFIFDKNCCGNRGKKCSNTPSKLRCEISKVLHKSAQPK